VKDWWWFEATSMRLYRLIFVVLAVAAGLFAQEVLMVVDEIPAMETLAAQFKARSNVASQIVRQTEMPASLARYQTVVVYIHMGLNQEPEKRLIEYARNGGNLMVLHHSISSGKRKNLEWLPFLGVTLPTGSLDQDGYAYFEEVTFEVVNLAPGEYVTTHDVRYDKKVQYASDGMGGEKGYDGFSVPTSEVYLNHRFDGPRTKLLGWKWTEPKSGRTYMQDTAGWHMATGKGSVYYFMVGHSAADFKIPAYAQILSNALRGPGRP